jgi:hypothetical protein
MFYNKTILYFRGQRMATELSANNPDLIDSIRRNMGNQPQPDGNNDSTSDDTPNGSTSLFN